MSRSIILKRVRLSGAIAAHIVAAGCAGVLINVIAGVHDQIQVVIQHVTIRNEVAVLVLLARRYADAQTFDVCAKLRRGACSTDWTLLTARREAIPILAT